MLLQELVDILHRGARAGGHALLAARLDDLRPAPLAGRHGGQNGELPLDHVVVDVGLFELRLLDLGHAGQQVEHVRYAAHFLHLLELLAQIVEVELAPLEFLGELLGLFLIEGPGRLLDEAVEGVETIVEEGKISGTKLPVADGDVADFALVAAREDESLGLYLVDLGGSFVERTTLDSFDPSRSQARLVFDGAACERLGEADASAISSLLDRAAVLTAFEQIGAAERAFEITREFILDRYAFGKPIGAFQAVKHRMADLWCDIELARSNAYYAAWALSNDDPELGVASCLARISACQAFEKVTVEMIEFHGGVGYTWEYDCHLFYRRAKLLSAFLGTPKYWKNLLIDRLQAQQAA